MTRFMRLPPPPKLVFAICIYHECHHHRGVLSNRIDFLLFFMQLCQENFDMMNGYPVWLQ